MKRIIYLGYHIKNLNKSLYKKFLDHTAEKYKRSKIGLISDSIYSVLRYKISLLEYFQFGFYDLSAEDRKKWAGTGYMYEYQRLMNPVKQREILDNKIMFSKAYSRFVKRSVFGKEELENSKENILQILSNPSGKVVLKAKSGNCGKQVEINSVDRFTDTDILTYMDKSHFDMAEDFIIQHPILSELSPNSVNTVRIFTNLNKQNDVEILGCRLRLGIYKNVDNLASGGITAAVDEKSGIVTTPGVYSDMTSMAELTHPVSGKEIVGFQIPFWSECVGMAKDAALLYKQNRSIGWDIAITANGPELIEGNHDWCKLVWQLPVSKGLKHVLDGYKADLLK